MVRVNPELLHKIVYMRDVECKNLRQIGRELDPPRSKDTVDRYYREAKAQGIKAEIPSSQPMHPLPRAMEEPIKKDRELKRKLKRKEKLEMEARLLRAKRETDERICNLLDDIYSNNYKARCELFEDPQKMWEFIEIVLSVKNPQLLDDFKGYVKSHKPCGTRDFPKLVSKFINSYTQKKDYENKFDSLAAYVEIKISDYLSLWKYYDQERLRRKVRNPTETVEAAYVEAEEEFFKERPFLEELAEAAYVIKEMREIYEKYFQKIEVELDELFKWLS